MKLGETLIIVDSDRGGPMVLYPGAFSTPEWEQMFEDWTERGITVVEVTVTEVLV